MNFRLTLVMAWLAKNDAPELVVAAAADPSSALREIGESYEKKTGVELKLSFSASGALPQEIENGAPFDLFFSADMDFPRKLVSPRAADPSSLYQYAEGKLGLWLPCDSPVHVEHKGLDVLLDPSVRKIAMPIAVCALRTCGGRSPEARRPIRSRREEVSGRENPAQAARFVESGNAQAGLVARAHAVAPGMQGKGKYWGFRGPIILPLHRAW